MSKLYLILAIHNHQPVGNFDHVFEESYQKAYLPFLESLLRHPSLKVVLHYSGNLLLWIEKRHPEAIDMIRALLRDGRAELLSGGFYEPILPVLPEKDRAMQIKEMTGYIKDRFGYAPKGMWLAERVWEPHMPEFISKAGVEYLSVDDYHFKLSGLEDGDLLGYYITEEDGHSIKVFPGNERLRYYIPFRNVDEIISYFRETFMRGGYPLLTMADDGEKFGVWPETYKHCHEDGWLDRFLSALEENSDWIETTTFSEYQERFYPIGTAYLPTAAYREMGEWALPSERALEYEYILNEMQKIVGERAKSLLRGGMWRSFLAKYPEANHIHKRMLMISRKVHEAARELKVESEKLKVKGAKLKLSTLNSQLSTLFHELWSGQCNDAYWHGIFGGLYLPHLRSSLYRHLLRAESIAEEILDKKVFIEEGDLDCDGFRDVCISRGDMTAFFTEKSGGLHELSLKKEQVNLLDTLTRRPEAYHSKISEATSHNHGETKTIHERLSVKEAGLGDYLVYDSYRRASLLDHFFDYGVRLDDLVRSEYEEMGDFIGGLYSIEVIHRKGTHGIKLSREGLVSGVGLKLEKSVILKKSGIRVDYLLEGKYSGIFAVEFNISLIGSPYASLDVRDKSMLIKDSSVHRDVNSFSIKDEFLKLRMTFSFDENIELWHYPVETISLSEQGVERLYQGTAFLFMKELDFSGNKRLGFTMKFGEDKR